MTNGQCWFAIACIATPVFTAVANTPVSLSHQQPMLQQTSLDSLTKCPVGNSHGGHEGHGPQPVDGLHSPLPLRMSLMPASTAPATNRQSPRNPATITTTDAPHNPCPHGQEGSQLVAARRKQRTDAEQAAAVVGEVAKARQAGEGVVQSIVDGGPVSARGGAVRGRAAGSGGGWEQSCWEQSGWMMTGWKGFGSWRGSKSWRGSRRSEMRC